MVDWDEDGPRLRNNLVRVLRRVRDTSRSREQVSVATAKSWHREMMDSLVLPDPTYAGTYRGEPGLEDCAVRVGQHAGVGAENVAQASPTRSCPNAGVLPAMLGNRPYRSFPGSRASLLRRALPTSR